MKKRWYITIVSLLISTLAALFYLILRPSTCRCGEKVIQRPYAGIRERVMVLLKTHSALKEYSAESLIEELGEPRDSIESAFHMSVERILEEHRVEKAAILLCTTDDTISCIAETVGFGNSRSLYGPFKRVHGDAPSVYREKQRG